MKSPARSGPQRRPEPSRPGNGPSQGLRTCCALYKDTKKNAARRTAGVEFLRFGKRAPGFRTENFRTCPATGPPFPGRNRAARTVPAARHTASSRQRRKIPGRENRSGDSLFRGARTADGPPRAGAREGRIRNTCLAGPESRPSAARPEWRTATPCSRSWPAHGPSRPRRSACRQSARPPPRRHRRPTYPSREPTPHLCPTR